MNVRKGIVVLATVAIASAIATVFLYWKAPVSTGQSVDSNVSSVDTPQLSQRALETSTHTVRPVENKPHEIEVPARYALFPGQKVAAASSWNELVDSLPAEDRELAELLGEKYPEAYTFTSAEQLEWMLANGFPAPQEFVAIARMGEQEVLQLAKGGNVKAAMLAYDRWMSELIADGSFLSGDASKNAELVEIEGKMRGTHCSPFPYYLSARYYEQVSQVSPSEANDSLLMAAAAYGVVESLGDGRARRTSEAILQGMPLTARTISRYGSAAARLRGRSAGGCASPAIPLR